MANLCVVSPINALKRVKEKTVNKKLWKLISISYLCKMDKHTNSWHRAIWGPMSPVIGVSVSVLAPNPAIPGPGHSLQNLVSSPGFPSLLASIRSCCFLPSCLVVRQVLLPVSLIWEGCPCSVISSHSTSSGSLELKTHSPLFKGETEPSWWSLPAVLPNWWTQGQPALQMS